MDELFNKSEKEILTHFIMEELKKNRYDEKNDIDAVVKKKVMITAIFSVITFIIVSLTFFHLRFHVFYLELINIAAYFLFIRKYTTVSYLIKEIKSRPDEEVAYIVSSVLSGGSGKTGRQYAGIGMIAASVILPCIIFFTPHTMYEKAEDGYYVRFYTKGVIQEKTVEIPEEYRGEPVVGIRGNVFAKLSKLETVILPDTITTIRGYAFQDCKNLTTVKMPDTMSYLGGGVFSGCRLLENITIPEGLTEIRGETFENCQYLEKIVIPEGVTRIGAHAFCGCMFMEEAIFPSTLKEIGSSAFRDCSYLEKVEIPEDTIVNERAFKNSPTEIYYMD